MEEADVSRYVKRNRIVSRPSWGQKLQRHRPLAITPCCTGQGMSPCQHSKEPRNSVLWLTRLAAATYCVFALCCTGKDPCLVLLLIGMGLSTNTFRTHSSSSCSGWATMFFLDHISTHSTPRHSLMHTMHACLHAYIMPSCTRALIHTFVLVQSGHVSGRLRNSAKQVQRGKD